MHLMCAMMTLQMEILLRRRQIEMGHGSLVNCASNEWRVPSGENRGLVKHASLS